VNVLDAKSLILLQFYYETTTHTKQQNLIQKQGTGSIYPMKHASNNSFTETATDLRRASRDLRRSNDASVRSVYINPDLTREQAQLAYQEREKRRARSSQRLNSDGRTTIGNDNTQPFR